MKTIETKGTALITGASSGIAAVYADRLAKRELWSFAQQPVSLAEALWRGLRMKCPHCGKGKLFGRYLKVADHCTVCCEELCHHRADDLPPYLVVTVVGHAIVPAALVVEINYALPIWLQLAIWLPLTLVSALALLQPIKGAVVGLQWQLGLGGFGESKLRRAT